MLYRCQICKAKFAIPENLERHMLTHESDEERKYECAHCGKVYLCRENFISHIDKHMTVNFTCVFCKKVFDNRHSLLIHKRLHDECNAQKHLCTECGCLFSRADYLKTHSMAVHSNIKHFRCDNCGVEFTRLGSLRKHQKNNVCQTVFRRRGLEQKNPDTELFQCNTCERSFTRRSSLRKHLRNNACKTEFHRRRLREMRLNDPATSNPKKRSRVKKKIEE